MSLASLYSKLLVTEKIGWLVLWLFNDIVVTAEVMQRRIKIGKDLEVGSIGPTLARSDLGKAEVTESDCCSDM